MIHSLSKALGTLVAALLMCPPHMQGQESEADSSDSDYTDEQSDAINRVDELMGRLPAMRWGPDVVRSISGLGATACRCSHGLGVRVFETAYSVVAESDFDLEDDWTLDTLSRLVSAASQCDPSFRNRALTREELGFELIAREHLAAVMSTVSTNPHGAAKSAGGVASHVQALSEWGQLAFLEGLQDLRQQLPADADRLFIDALLVAAAAGTTADLFTLGNYVFGPKSERDGAIEVSPLEGGGQVYYFAEVRPGFSNELASQYVGIATDALLKRGTPISQDAKAFALATQLASWAEDRAPEHAAALDGLLDSQTDSIANSSHFSELHGLFEPGDEDAPLAGLERDIESAVDEETKAFLRLMLCTNRIRQGPLSGAEDVLADMRPELRRPLSDIIELKRATEAITNDDLQDATTRVAGLRDSLHQALGALSLASAFWARSKDAENGSPGDRDSADRALQLAVGALRSVPEHLRPHVRIKLAAVLAKRDQTEEALGALEFGLQGLNTDRSNEKIGELVVSVTASQDGKLYAETDFDGELIYIDHLDPPNLRDAHFVWTISYLSSSPETDLDRLDAIASKSVDPRLRADGLVAVAKGALARAFDIKTE